MNALNLSLRQRKLLHYIQNQKTYITGEDLASYLQVSDRTIRNDVNEINRSLKEWKIEIISKRSKGYILRYENELTLKRLNQSSSSFLSRDDRIRHITFRLCLSDESINLYDLEDEMFVSRTTLEHDLEAMRKKYVLPYPHIKYYRSKNRISFGPDERKRRSILNRLFTENWNYNARGNAYYQYQYLEENIVNLVMTEVTSFMQQYNILMDDINIVILNLAISIMYYRITTGHELMSPLSHSYMDATAIHAGAELMDSLEGKLDCSFSEIERNDIYQHISCSRLLDANSLNFATVDKYFDHSIIRLADEYILKVYETFHMDFSNDEDFYITFLQYLRYLSLPIHHFNHLQAQTDSILSNLRITFEIAFLIQPQALNYFGNYLNYTELLYLSFCVSSALEYLKRTSPKIKTIIMCHLNVPCAQNLKQKLLSKFKGYLDLYALLPIFVKDSYDFNKIDLVISTANKEITRESSCKTIIISPFFTPDDQRHIDQYIVSRQMNQFHASPLPSTRKLFADGFWHECIDAENYLSIIELLANDFISRGYVSPEYLPNILQRESLMTFALQPGIVLMYSLIPSTLTRVAVATLNHRVKWNSYKIRTIIMVAVRPEDTTLIFKLIQELYDNNLNPESARFFKTKEEILDFFGEEED